MNGMFSRKHRPHGWGVKADKHRESNGTLVSLATVMAMFKPDLA